MAEASPSTPSSASPSSSPSSSSSTPVAPSPTGTFCATGKRKTAVARVRLTLGSGLITVNGRPLDVHFPRATHQQMVHQPLEATNSLGRYDIAVTLHGGGPAGQAGALRHGIARAIEQLDPTQRLTLKRAGYLTRDARKKERKKYGQKGARARYQFSKR